MTSVFCLAINGFCFWLTERMSDQQFETRTKQGKKIDIAFDVSYYLIVLASGMSILATAFTLLRRYPSDDDHNQLELILDEFAGNDAELQMERSLPATAHPTVNRQSLAYLNSSAMSNSLLSYSQPNTSSSSSPQHAAMRPSATLTAISTNNAPIGPPPTPPPPSTPLRYSDGLGSTSMDDLVPPPPYITSSSPIV